MIEQIVTVLHVLIAFAIIGLILLQQGQGADMGASFGSGSSQTLFGPTGGGNVLTRVTSILVTLFFVTSFGLAIIAKQKVQALSAEEQLLVPENVSETTLPAGEQPLQIEGLEDAVPAVDDIPLEANEDAGDIVDHIPE